MVLGEFCQFLEASRPQNDLAKQVSSCLGSPVHYMEQGREVSRIPASLTGISRKQNLCEKWTLSVLNFNFPNVITLVLVLFY